MSGFKQTKSVFGKEPWSVERVVVLDSFDDIRAGIFFIDSRSSLSLRTPPMEVLRETFDIVKKTGKKLSKQDKIEIAKERFSDARRKLRSIM